MGTGQALVSSLDLLVELHKQMHYCFCLQQLYWELRVVYLVLSLSVSTLKWQS